VSFCSDRNIRRSRKSIISDWLRHFRQRAGVSWWIVKAAGISPRSSYDLVAMDSFQSGYLLGNTLLGRCRTVAFIAKPLPLHYDQRLAVCEKPPP